ncbi:MAG: YmfQ family protein [Eubacterium sp.]|nr:YmfQ family protein [Eubacterium sp.]
MQTLILNHYPPVIKQIKEMQQIAKAEDIEFSKLNVSINEVIRNMFVFTADETGVMRFEKLLGIKPKVEQSLDDRKIYVLSMMNRRKMSLSELMTMLSNYAEGITILNDIANMEMIVEVGASTVNIHTINDILEEILPLNIYFHFTIKMRKAEIKVSALQKAAGKLKIKSLLGMEITANGE